MIETIRHCPDCGQVRRFEQPHPDSGECPDSPDGSCPEWLCTGCRAAWLIGYVRYLRAPAAAHLHRRVA
jgi:hypothetical protein